MDISSESDDKEDELVSFDGKIDPSQHLANIVAHSRLSQNLASVTRKRKQPVFSPESSETEYSSESETFNMICSPDTIRTSCLR